MDNKIIITGKNELKGSVKISSAKNSVLKLMAASLLAETPTTILNTPDIEDVRTMMKLLMILGCEVERTFDGTLIINPTIKRYEAPYEVVSRMRASIVVMGPLLTRFGKARVSLPGGCNIGRRKLDLHIRGLTALGAKIETEGGFISAKSTKLKGNEINLHFASVGATENIILASVLAEGETIIENAAREPEIVDLCQLLKGMGAQIYGEGTSVIRVKGVSSLKGVVHTPIPDRIEAGTYILAAVVTQGEVEVQNVNYSHLEFFLEKLTEAGGQFSSMDGSIKVKQKRRLNGIDVATLPYPGFPTDLQPQMMAALCYADGVSVITENIFENRFLHVDELVRMGANIDIQGKHAIIKGKEAMTGVPVRAMDLRGGVALCVAALAAEGETRIEGAGHIFRGYENFIEKMLNINADIKMIEGEDNGRDYFWD